MTSPIAPSDFQRASAPAAPASGAEAPLSAEGFAGTSSFSAAHGAWRVSYQPGEWTLLSGPSAVVVLEPAPGRASVVVTRIWELALSASGPDDLVSRLSGVGLDAMPNLVLVFRDGSGLRALLRGDVRLTDADGRELGNGAGVRTWREVELAADVVDVHLPTGQHSDDQLTLPMLTGAARAGWVRIDVSDDALPVVADPWASQDATDQNAPVDNPAEQDVIDQGATGQDVIDQGVPVEVMPVVEPVVVRAVPVDAASLGADVASDAPVTDEAPLGEDQEHLGSQSSDNDDAREQQDGALQEAATAEGAPQRPRFDEDGFELFDQDAEAQESAKPAMDPEPVRDQDADSSHGHLPPAALASAPVVAAPATVLPPVPDAGGVPPWLRTTDHEAQAGPATGDAADEVETAHDDASHDEADRASHDAADDHEEQAADAVREPHDEWQLPSTADVRASDPYGASAVPSPAGPYGAPPAWTPIPAEHHADATDHPAQPHDVAAGQPRVVAFEQHEPPASRLDQSAHLPAVHAQLRTSAGDRVLVTGPVLVGRAPSPRGDSAAQLLRVPSPSQDISRTHLLIDAPDGQLQVTDLHSTNGTIITSPDGATWRLSPGVPVPLEMGTIIDLGDGVTIDVAPHAG